MTQKIVRAIPCALFWVSQTPGDEGYWRLSDGSIVDVVAAVREADTQAKEPGPWLLLDRTSNSGKQLWACRNCGYTTPDPTRTHECKDNA